jgi:hypothetical protein
MNLVRNRILFLLLSCFATSFFCDTVEAQLFRCRQTRQACASKPTSRSCMQTVQYRKLDKEEGACKYYVHPFEYCDYRTKQSCTSLSNWRSWDPNGTCGSVTAPAATSAASVGPYFCNRVNSAYQCAATCQLNNYKCYSQSSQGCPSDKPWGCYCSNDCIAGVPMPTANYVVSCTFYCSGGYSVTGTGSGTSPALARTAAENNAIGQGCIITSYGNCTITP